MTFTTVVIVKVNTPQVKLENIPFTALKKAFVAQKDIQKMAKQDFIMVNLVVSTSAHTLRYRSTLIHTQLECSQ